MRQARTLCELSRGPRIREIPARPAFLVYHSATKSLGEFLAFRETVKVQKRRKLLFSKTVRSLTDRGLPQGQPMLSVHLPTG